MRINMMQGPPRRACHAAAKVPVMPVTLVRCSVLISQYKLTSGRPRRRKSEPTEQWCGDHSWSEEHYSTDDVEGCLVGMSFDPARNLGVLGLSSLILPE